ncbi:(ribosomal protein S5)-alanine N-acetyltransferase [Alphaproteobacteria bacterium]
MKSFNFQGFFSKFPNIDLGDIRLRDLSVRDQNNYYQLLSDPEVSKYLSDEDIPQSVEAALAEIRFYGSLFYRKQSVFWAISYGESQELIGTIGFNSWNFHNRRAEISYDLMSPYFRRGIMTKVLSNVITFGLQKMMLNRIEARTMLDNIASCKILEKMNFKQEGVLKSYRIIRGQPTDIILFSLIRQDFHAFL